MDMESAVECASCPETLHLTEREQLLDGHCCILSIVNYCPLSAYYLLAIYLSVYLPFCLLIYLSIYLSIYLYPKPLYLSSYVSRGLGNAQLFAGFLAFRSRPAPATARRHGCGLRCPEPLHQEKILDLNPKP